MSKIKKLKYKKRTTEIIPEKGIDFKLRQIQIMLQERNPF